MTTSAALGAYKKTKNETLSQEDVGHNVIQVSLKKLETSLDLLFSAVDNKIRAKAFESSLMTIYFLQKSLDFSTGGELAQNLFRLYEFCRVKVLQHGSLSSKGNEEIRKCQNFIGEIVKSWDTIKPMA